MKIIPDIQNDTEDMSEQEKDATFKHKGNKNEHLDEITLIATPLVMLVAGYDTTAQTLSYCGYELVKNPDIQRRLQDEIDDVMEQNGGELPDYNQTQSMEYLDMVVHETLVRYFLLNF